MNCNDIFFDTKEELIDYIVDINTEVLDDGQMLVYYPEEFFIQKFIESDSIKLLKPEDIDDLMLETYAITFIHEEEKSGEYLIGENIFDLPTNKISSYQKYIEAIPEDLVGNLN